MPWLAARPTAGRVRLSLRLDRLAYSATNSTSIFRFLIPPTSHDISFTRMTSSSGFANAVFAYAGTKTRRCFGPAQVAAIDLRPSVEESPTMPTASPTSLLLL